MMRRPNLGIIGGVVAALALSGCAGTALAADELPPTTGGEFCAEMPDVTGLYADNPVTQMGYRIGRVAAVQPRGDRVLVTFEIDTPPRAIPADVKAVIRSKSLLADRSLELVGELCLGSSAHRGPMHRPHQQLHAQDDFGDIRFRSGFRRRPGPRR